ncbi:LAFA_0E08834g1_1 [Lachancea sp. 'fantastica']|nr:LAFA_0E08834g1_1 [Lachancea sp. 'fantastica']
MANVCAHINELAKANSSGFFSSFAAFKTDNWNLEQFTQEFLDKLTKCEDSKQRKQHLQSLMYEILMLLSTDDVGGLEVEEARNLISKIYMAEGPKIARIFIVLVNSLPEKSEKTQELIRRLYMMDGDFCTYVLDDKLLEKTQKFSARQRALFKKSLLDSGYMIHKFNLLCENPVAYSQLVTLLLVAYSDPTNIESASTYWHEAQCIIGKYSLDPLRALDVILIVSSQYITDNYHFLVKFLRVSTYWPDTTADCSSPQNLGKGGNIMASQLLTMHLKDGDVDVKLFDMVCVLMKEGLVSFSSVFDNLGPNDEEIQKFTDKFYMKLEADSMKGVSNPLAMAAALADDAEDANKPSTDDAETTEAVGATQTELDKSKEMTEKNYLERGKMLLLQRLLAHGAVVPFLCSFQNYSRFLLTSETTIKLYLRIFEHSITPLYSSLISYTPKATKSDNGLIPTHNVFQTLQSTHVYRFYYDECMRHVKEVHDIDDFIKSCHESLTLIGPHVARAPIVVSKLCRVALSDIHRGQKDESKMLAWLNFTRKFILPALPLLTENSAIVNETFDLLRQFDYEKRYFLYNELSSKLAQDDTFSKAAWNSSAREARSLLKSLSIDNVDKKGKNFAKILAKNPVSTLDPIMNQLENYDKLADLVVETSLHFSDFTYDVLQYHILLRLTSGRRSLQDSGIHVMMWVQRIAVFIAELAKRSSKMDITNIIRFVIKRLHINDMIAVTVIRELTSRVGGVKAINDLNTKQLMMLNSGPPLQKIARTVIRDLRSENRESAQRLLNVFISENALSEVIILLDHLSKKSVDEDIHYKVLSSKIDDINSLLWAFIDMSKYFLGSEVFKNNIVDFEHLISEYSLSMEWAFLIWREYYDENLHDDIKLQEQFDEAIDKANFIPQQFKEEHRGLYVKFWKLSLYDVCFQKELYDNEKSLIEKNAINTKSIKKKQDLSRQIESIMASRIAHQRAHNRFLESLASSSINITQLKSSNMVSPFLQYCVVPRALFSPADALFVVIFVWKTFGISGALDIIEEFLATRILGSLLFSSTGSEASCLGFFFANYLERLEVARKSQELSDEDLKRLFKIQGLIAEDIVNLIVEQNYMSIRNGIEFMKHLSAVFPVVKYDILQMIKSMERLISVDKREDILLPSNALIGHLKARLKGALDLDAFYHLSPEDREEFGADEKDLITKHHEALKEEEIASKKAIAAKEAKDHQTAELAQKSHPEEETDSGPQTSSRFGRVPPLPMYEILNEMWDIVKCLEANRTAFLYRHLRNKRVLSELHTIEKTTVRDLEEYRSRLAELLESFYRNLVTSPNHEKFKQRLNGMLSACKSVTNPYSTQKKVEGRYQTQKIEYDDEPVAEAAKSLSSQPDESRFKSSAHIDDSKRQSRYGGFRKPEQKENRAGRSNGDEGASHSRSDRNKSDHFGKSRPSDASNARPSRVPEKNGLEQRPSRTGSRYEGQAATGVSGAGNDTIDSKKAQSPIPRGPSRANPSQRGSVANSRYGDGSANKIKIGDRNRLDSSRADLAKRPREDSGQSHQAKRAKPDRGFDRGRFSNSAPHGVGRETSKSATSSTGRYDRKPQNDRAGEERPLRLPAGPRGQKPRPNRDSRSSPAPEGPSSSTPQSRYQK